MTRRTLPFAAAATLAFETAHAAAPGGEATPSNLDTMQQRLNQLESMVGTLRVELDAERAARQRVESTTLIRPVSDGKSLKFASPGNAFSFQVGGRLEADAATYEEDQQDLGDGIDIRRARLYARGTLARDFDRPGNAANGDEPSI